MPSGCYSRYAYLLSHTRMCWCVCVNRVFLTPQNASRLVASLCRMRGAALKVAQMVSLQEEQLPPEIQVPHYFAKSLLLLLLVDDTAWCFDLSFTTCSAKVWRSFSTCRCSITHHPRTYALALPLARTTHKYSVFLPLHLHVFVFSRHGTHGPVHTHTRAR